MNSDVIIKLFGSLMIFRAMALFFVLLAVTLGSVLSASGWFLKTIVHREMDIRNESITQLKTSLHNSTDTISNQLTQIRESIISVDRNIHSVDRKLVDSTSKLSNEILKSNSVQNQDFTKLEANVKGLDSAVNSIRSDIDKSSEQTEKTIADLSDGINKNISDLETETKEATQKVDSISEISEADIKFQVIEEMLSLGISNAAVQQAILSVMVNKEVTDARPGTVSALLQKKSELTPTQFFNNLQETYKAGTREAMLIAYDELTEERTVEFFLELQEIEDILPPDLAAAHATSSDGGAALEKLRTQPRTIVGICSEMASAPDTACYAFFRTRALTLSNEGTNSAVRISEAALRAIEDKYTDKIRVSMGEE